jgi:hypothetical protein
MVIGLCALGTALFGIGVGLIKVGSMTKTIDDLESARKESERKVSGLERMVYEMRGAQKAQRENETTP